MDNLIITDDTNLVFAPALNQFVNKATGVVTLRNTTGAPIPISGYTIESASGMLNAGTSPGDFDGNQAVNGSDFLVWQRSLPTLTAADLAAWKANFGDTGSAGGWSSLADQHPAGFPAGNGSGNGWEEGASPSSTQLAEYYLTGQSDVVSGA